VTFLVTKTFLPAEVITNNIYKIIYQDNEATDNPEEESVLPSVSKESSLPSTKDATTPRVEPQVTEFLSQADSLREAGNYEEALKIYAEKRGWRRLGELEKQPTAITGFEDPLFRKD
jgi:hypothetical protein